MPVRVRCPQCEKVIVAPDAARGKAVKCPECQGRVPVPAAESESAPSGKPTGARPEGKAPAKPAAKAAPAKKKPAEDDDDFLAKLDLSRSEDRSTKVCPKCGAVVEEEDTECASCGVDLQTGGLGKTARKARMKGADPADFFSKAWKDGVEFLKENLGITINSWINVLIMFAGSAVALLLAAVFNAYDHKPSFIFFLVLGTLGSLGVYGWFLSLSSKVVMHALEKKIKLDRTSFEIFTAMATGVSWTIWTVASAVPFLPIIAPVYLFTRDSGPAINYGLTAVVALFFAWLPIPCVIAHRAMPVDWMIWVSPLMWKIAIKNIGAVLFCWVVAFCTWLPIALLILGEVLLLKSFLISIMQAVGIKDTSAIETQTAAMGFPFSTGSIGVVGAIFVVLGMLILRIGVLFLFSCWSMYMLRVCALFTFYNKKGLELISEVKEKAYVAKKIELGPDGEPINKTAQIQGILTVVIGIVVLYGASCMIMASAAPEYIPMPKFLAEKIGLIPSSAPAAPAAAAPAEGAAGAPGAAAPAGAAAPGAAMPGAMPPGAAAPAGPAAPAAP